MWPSCHQCSRYCMSIVSGTRYCGYLKGMSTIFFKKMLPGFDFGDPVAPSVTRASRRQASQAKACADPIRRQGPDSTTKERRTQEAIRRSHCCAAGLEHARQRGRSALHGDCCCQCADVPGVNDTPCKTSANPAVCNVVKLSPDGRVVALKLSVIATSLLGSAPWSPFPLTVEVMAFGLRFQEASAAKLRSGSAGGSDAANTLQHK